MRWIILTLTLLLAYVGFAETISVKEESHEIAFDRLFSKKQQVDTGIVRLTSYEKDALHSHIEKLLVQISKAAESKATARLKDESHASMYVSGKHHWLKSNIDNGSLITLEDGSVWEVAPDEKVEAMLWLSLSGITVEASYDGSSQYDYLLINMDDKEAVHARWIK